MSRDTLYVTPKESHWQLTTDEAQGDADIPRYDSKEAAVSAAILSAENSRERGRDARVLVQDSAEQPYREERSFSGRE
ncbi:hypothetical protein [Algiphilus aromaticivorans]|jgi:hypothetical protein|uniref:hypothetical protein n=1 Tax=Algiphilus aromaticivorans TaxID=382454 RepID=UPI0005C1F82A|nr:hypothetical protein [Algiphilus aromaticivorans]